MDRSYRSLAAYHFSLQPQQKLDRSTDPAVPAYRQAGENGKDGRRASGGQAWKDKCNGDPAQALEKNQRDLVAMPSPWMFFGSVDSEGL
jgi:hypothetical protein